MGYDFPTIQQWKRGQLMLTLDAGGTVDCPDCHGEGCVSCDGGRLPLCAAFDCDGYKAFSLSELKKYASEVTEIFREYSEQSGIQFCEIVKPFLSYCTDRYIQVDMTDEAYLQASAWVSVAGEFSAEQIMAVLDVRVHRARSIIKRLLGEKLIKPVTAESGNRFFIAAGR